VLIATNTIAPPQILFGFFAFAVARNVLLRLSPRPNNSHGRKKMETLRNEELFEIEGGFWEGLAAAAYAFVTALVLL
jgi:hypothetical protein